MEIITSSDQLEHPDADDSAANVFPDDRHLTAVTKAAPDTLLTPTEKKKARAALTALLLACENYRDIEDYTQQRPYERVIIPGKHWVGDCSSLLSQAFLRASKVTGIYLEDPNGREYDGFGWTGTLLQVNHQHAIPLTRKFLVGDLALYGGFWSTKHVVVCRSAGTATTAVWTSHGSMAGPLPTRLKYRDDLLGVYRPLSLL